MKRQEYMTPEDESPRLVGVQYDTGEEKRNSFRKKDEAGPKWKRRWIVDMSGGCGIVVLSSVVCLLMDENKWLVQASW